MTRVPKVLVAVRISTVFADFMRHVASLIESGDESTTVESDDLLQCDCIYGGLYDPEARRFGEFDALASEVASHGRSLRLAWIDGNVTALSDLDANSLLEFATI